MWRERCHCLAVDALLRLAAGYAARAEYELAIRAARRLVELEPWHEEAQRQLMGLLAATGRRSEALAQYGICRRLLADELGVSPSAETDELYAQIRSDLQAAAAAPAAPEVSAVQDAGQARSRRLLFLDDEIADHVSHPLFVARQRELAQLMALLEQTMLDGNPRAMMIAGEAGQGKTSLLRAYAQQAEVLYPELLVVSGSCNAYTGIGDPYLPFRQILGHLTGDVELDWAAGVLSTGRARRLWRAFGLVIPILIRYGPDLVETLIPGEALLNRAQLWQAQNGGGSSKWWELLLQVVARRAQTPAYAVPPQTDLFEQYTRVLYALAQELPLLILLDDLQWADFGSISLLHHIGLRPGAGRLLIAGAYRPEEIALELNERRYPLAALLGEFQRQFGLITLMLGERPDRQFVDELLDSEPNRLGSHFRTTLLARTAGHPLCTVELVRSMQDRGELVRDATGRWVEGSAVDWTAMPPKVEGAVALRISSLPAEWHALLAAASVQGEEFAAEIVAEVAGCEAHATRQLLSDTLGRQLRLVEALGRTYLETGGRWLSRFRFRHHLFQQYLYQHLDPVERAAYHAATGRVLESFFAGSLPGLAVTMAWHFEQAGDTQKALTYFQRAGERALRMAAHAEALAHFQRALNLLAALPDSTARMEQELQLQLALGTTLIVIKGQAAAEVEEVFARAQQLAEQVGKTTELFMALWNQKSFYDVGAKYDRSLVLNDRLLRMAEESGDRKLQMAAYLTAGGLYTYMGRLPLAHRYLQSSYALYDRRHHAALRDYHGQDPGVTALSWEALTLWVLGYPDQAAHCSRQVLALAHDLGHPFTLVYALVTSCFYGHLCRDIPGVLERSQAAFELAEQHGYSLWLSGACQYHAWATAFTSRCLPVVAAAQCRRGVEDFLTTGAQVTLPQALAALSELEALSGLFADALAVNEQALTICQTHDERYFEPELHRRKGELLLVGGTGSEAEAERCYRHALDLALALDMMSWALRAARSLARLYQAQGRAAEARSCLGDIYASFTEGFDSPDLVSVKALLAALDASSR